MLMPVYIMGKALNELLATERADPNSYMVGGDPHC